MSEMNIFDPHIPTEIMDCADKVADFCSRNGSEGWQLGRVADRTAFIKANNKVESLQQQLAEAKETVSKHEQLMIRVNERVQTIRFSEDRVYIYQPSNEEFDDLRKEIFILQQEREKLQALVQELLTALKFYASPRTYGEDLIEYGSAAVPVPGTAPIMYDNGEIAKKALKLELSNLPRFVPEEKVKELINKLEAEMVYHEHDHSLPIRVVKEVISTFKTEKEGV